MSKIFLKSSSFIFKVDFTESNTFTVFSPLRPEFHKTRISNNTRNIKQKKVIPKNKTQATL